MAGGSFHLGCRELLNVVTNIVKPKLHLFGHVHRSYGKFDTEHESGRTIFVNASLCDSYFRLSNSPIVVDLIKNESNDF